MMLSFLTGWDNFQKERVWKSTMAKIKCCFSSSSGFPNPGDSLVWPSGVRFDPKLDSNSEIGAKGWKKYRCSSTRAGQWATVCSALRMSREEEPKALQMRIDCTVGFPPPPCYSFWWRLWLRAKTIIPFYCHSHCSLQSGRWFDLVIFCVDAWASAKERSGRQNVCR